MTPEDDLSKVLVDEPLQETRVCSVRGRVNSRTNSSLRVRSSDSECWIRLDRVEEQVELHCLLGRCCEVRVMRRGAECAVIPVSDGFGGDEAEVAIRGFGFG